MTFQKPLTVEEICNKLRPVFGKKIDEIYFRYSLAEGREEREEIAHTLNALYQKNLNKLLDKGVLLEPPREGVLDGTYNLATVSYSGKKLFPFKLREKDWPRHICITGMSGAGKTTFALKILEALTENNKPYLVFDWKKSFRPQIEKDHTVLAFTIGDNSISNLLKTNINKPPKGVSPKEWINVLCDLLTESFQASFGVHKVLLETLDNSFKEWGIYNGSENYPTWNHIKWKLEEKMEKIHGREAGWLESALRIATVLTFGEFGKTVNYKGDNSISIEELLNKRVIMELNSLGNVEKKFFCEFLLTYIYKMKKAKQNETNNNFDHAILVDEAHNIFLKKQTNFTNESVTDMIYREMREYGTSLICLDQHISKISDTVKGNSACHVAFQQQLPQDIFDISELMQLRENKHYFSGLKVGNAIVRLSERYTEPFLIQVPYNDEKEIFITNEDVKSRMDAMILGRGYERGNDKEFNEAIENPVHVKSIPIKEIKSEGKDHDFTKVQDLIYDYVTQNLKAGVELERIEKVLEESKGQGGFTSSDIMQVINKVFENQLLTKLKKDNNLGKKDLNNLNKDQQIFIEFLQENLDHTLSTVEVYQKIGLSARKGTNAKKALEEKGLIKILEEKYDKGWKKLIRLAN